MSMRGDWRLCRALTSVLVLNNNDYRPAYPDAVASVGPPRGLGLGLQRRRATAIAYAERPATRKGQRASSTAQSIPGPQTKGVPSRYRSMWSKAASFASSSVSKSGLSPTKGLRSRLAVAHQTCLSFQSLPPTRVGGARRRGLAGEARVALAGGGNRRATRASLEVVEGRLRAAFREQHRRDHFFAPVMKASNFPARLTNDLSLHFVFEPWMALTANLTHSSRSASSCMSRSSRSDIFPPHFVASRLAYRTTRREQHCRCTTRPW